MRQLGIEGRILLRRLVGCFQLQDQRHQGLGDETPAIKPEMAALVRTGAVCVRLGCVHGSSPGFQPAARRAGWSATRTAATKARINAGSFWPGALSTPDETSIPVGRTA